MKSLNGLVFIVLGALAIWVGATGRLPALAAALGMVRAVPGTGNKTTPSAPTNAPKIDAQSGAVGLTPKGSAYLSDLQKELAIPWSQTWLGAMKDVGMVN